jgi:hypothetical protein
MAAILYAGTLKGLYDAVGGKRVGAIVALVAVPLLPASWTGMLPNWYAATIFVVLMGLFLISHRVKPAIKTLLWWNLAAFGLYMFLTVRPGNHYYVFMPPVIFLAAVTLDWGLRRLDGLRFSVRQWALPGAVGVLVALFALSSWYQQTVYLRTDLEYLLTYPQHRNPAFWSDPRYPFAIRIGLAFPHRLGWQTISNMYRNGELNGDWYGTDEDNAFSSTPSTRPEIRAIHAILCLPPSITWCPRWRCRRTSSSSIIR